MLSIFLKHRYYCVIMRKFVAEPRLAPQATYAAVGNPFRPYFRAVSQLEIGFRFRYKSIEEVPAAMLTSLTRQERASKLAKIRLWHSLVIFITEPNRYYAQKIRLHH